MISDSLPQGWAIAKTSECIEAKGIIADGDWIAAVDRGYALIIRIQVK